VAVGSVRSRVPARFGVPPAGYRDRAAADAQGDHVASASKMVAPGVPSLRYGHWTGR